ncbi:MAG: AraC family transcriptional regulator [Fuerstiella sp.]|nr:AraC family transcriptional regulator [Fuerstiella sp.]MCP4856870.1 AraC family transcriptional regulator [Fuerstiella sp.]
MKEQQPPDVLPEFVSRQVTESRHFFLNLTPNRRAGLEVVCGGVERMRPDYVVDRTDFPYFAIELVAEGEGTLTIDGRQYPLTPGVVFAYGPRTLHTIRNRPDHDMRKYYLDFVGTRAAGLLSEAGLTEGPGQFQAVSVSAVHELTELFEMFLRSADHGGPQVNSILESLAQLLTLKIAQLRLPEGRAASKSYATYERARNHIDEAFVRLHTIEQVADECDVTPVHLSRLFGRFSDCGAYEYLLRRRMNHAAGLMMSEGLLVKEVAQRLDFRDAYQFSRAFKRVYGIPPSQLVTGRE